MTTINAALLRDTAGERRDNGKYLFQEIGHFRASSGIAAQKRASGLQSLSGRARLGRRSMTNCRHELQNTIDACVSTTVSRRRSRHRCCIGVVRLWLAVAGERTMRSSGGLSGSALPHRSLSKVVQSKA